ncbi:MAG TPA: hypothetical protein VF198_00375 [Vicinamibacterales bacterium]
MPVDLRERELLPQLVALPLVCVEVDALREDERFIQPIKPLLNRLDAPLVVGRGLPDGGLLVVPRAQDRFLDEAHVGRRRL